MSTRKPPAIRKVHWYRWEFLRRNAEYQADYAAFMKSFGSWFGQRCYWFEDFAVPAVWTSRDKNYFHKNIFPAIAELCHKWKIGDLFSPRWKFDRKSGKRRFRREELYLPTGLSPELNWDTAHMGALFKGFTGTPGGEGGTSTICCLNSI